MCYDDLSFTKACQEIINYAFRAGFEWCSVDQTYVKQQGGNKVVI